MRPHLPMPLIRRWYPTVRVRLAGLYGVLFLGTGGILLASTYLLQKHTLDDRPLVVGVSKGSLQSLRNRGVSGHLAPVADASQIASAVLNARADMLHRLLVTSAESVAVLAVVGVAVGWWLAGRVLLPLKRITGTARHLSSANLDERIGLDGPADELKRLADTFDEMLDRLERSFEGQRRFIANVSHELRTPLAVQRTALELGLLEPTAADVARVRSELLAANRRTERLIDGLLTLARSDCGPLDRQPVALDEIVRQAADQNAPAARAAGVRVELALEPATVNGEASLLLQLAANLIQNGVRHNHRGGCVRAEVSPAAGLRVTNTGPVVPEERLGQLFEPFARLGPARTGSDDEGAGLGLSIVWSICHVHEVPLRAVCQPGGGLDIRVPFRAVLPADPPALSAPATRQAS